MHAHGRIIIRDDEAFVRGIVARLTRRHEATEPKPWKMGDSSPEYIDGMLEAIVGIEIAIDRLEGKSKLSQNREIQGETHRSAGAARRRICGWLRGSRAGRSRHPVGS